MLVAPLGSGSLARGLDTELDLQLAPVPVRAVYLWFDGVEMEPCDG